MVSGCSQDEVVKEEFSSSEPLVFTASFEENKSRTYLNEDEHLRWNAKDLISIFAANTYNQKYEFQGETGANSGDFKAVTSSSYPTGNELSRHYAIYPYDSSTTISENGAISATLPAEQSYAVKSFGLEANTMVATTADKSDRFLKFKNIGGYLELNLYGNNVTVKSITLQGNSNEKIAGSATITPTYNGNPTVVMANNATNTITLDCGDGVSIGSTEGAATAFWMVVPPTTFEDGFTINVTDINGNTFTKSTSKNIKIERNVIQSMSAFEVDITPYLTFKAKDTQSLKLSMPVQTLQFSVNGSNWEELEDKTIDFGGTLGDLRIRGKSSFGTATKLDDLKYFIFGNDVEVSCYGDIRTLVDYENYATTNTSKAKFISLFYGCTSLITAPSLPAKNLAEDCYFGMFAGCTKLKNAPALPAIKLAAYCYEGMFLNCSSLTKAPQLPATELAPACYRGMFKNCVNLTTPPELPAMKLTWNCYHTMFEGCSSLTAAPSLPATELAYECYFSMFLNCRSLTIAPSLPATTLVGDHCYYRMFEGCTSLKIAPSLPATTLTPFCYDSMFKGCTSLTTAPTLSATTLAEYCYRGMFFGCTNLIKSPILPATTLAEYCYQSMFSGCSNLNEITMLAPNFYPENSFYAWVAGVSSDGLFIKSKELKSMIGGNSGIPSGWTVKNYGE